MNWLVFPDWVQREILSIFSELRRYDEETFQHCLRVGKDSRLLAKAEGLCKDSQIKMEWAGMLHDVGKAKIPKEVLFKPGPLTEAEYQLVQDHSKFSAQMMEPLTELEFFRHILPVVLHHHERLDGLGYPHGLAGESVPFGSRILLIADTFDAMTHRRSYRKGLDDEVAYAELAKFSGTQFDPNLVKVFIEHKPDFASVPVHLEGAEVVRATGEAPELASSKVA